MKTLRLIILFTMLTALAFQANAASISVSKEVTPVTPNRYHRGDTIHYVIKLENPSPDFTLTIESVTDTLPDGNDGTSDLVGPTPPYTLAVSDGNSGSGPDCVTYTLDWVVPMDASAGTVVNTINAAGTQNSTPDPDPASGMAQKTSRIIVPCVEVTKTVDPNTSKTGDEVEYTITVCNCGDVNIIPESVVDSILGDLSSSYVEELASMDCEEHSFVHEVNEVEGAADTLVNVVVANYEDTYGYDVNDTDDAIVDLVHPCLEVTKSCLTDPVPEGGSAIFRVTITNCGDVALDVNTSEPAHIPAFTLPADQNSSTDIAVDACDVDVYNTITVQATLPVELGLDNVIGPYEANDTCPIEEEGATRTLGFWKNHCEYTQHVLEVHCGGPFDLGWIVVSDINDLLGVLFANPAKNSNGSKRNKLCQARIIASRQAVVALLNNCLDNGAPLPVTPEDIADILGATNWHDILDLAEELDEYNNSGDDIAIIDGDGFLFGNATPRDCAGDARVGAADCTARLRRRALKLGL